MWKIENLRFSIKQDPPGNRRKKLLKQTKKRVPQLLLAADVMDPNCGPAGSLINGWLGNRRTGKIGDGTEGLQADQFFLQSFIDVGL